MRRRRDRERDREDRDRGYGGRDRDRDYRERDRRDREGSQSSVSPATVNPVQILKRPGGLSQPSSSATSSLSVSSLSQPSSSISLGSRDREMPAERERDLPKVVAPTVILQRSATSKRQEGVGDVHGVGQSPSTSAPSSSTHSQHEHSVEPKPKTNAPLTVFDVLKPPYKFPIEKAITLSDNSMKMKTDFDFILANKFNTDFFVVTAVGVPLSGKSTILSFLSNEDGFGVKNIFTGRNKDQQKECSIYLTSDQILFIEMASVFNGAAAYDLIPYVAQQGTLETASVTWNLRMMRWALSISHVVVIVSESLIDPNLFQLINTAEMIHPMEYALGEGAHPELVYVCNKAPLSYLDDENVLNEVDNIFSTVLNGRPSRIEQNFYVLPHRKWGYAFDLYDEFKKNIHDFSRRNRAPFAADSEDVSKFPQKITMQEWFFTASKFWEDMSHPNYFAPYVKLLP